MATVNARKPPTVASVSRVTKNGRHLTYTLTVIQQPERARACGSGAKSSADRRPVDPPPVVELRIWEGKEGEQKEDITFGYGANFFLFATLEVARPMAHGRVQQAATPQIPVLTGMPVSGMAYLDRPSEAGYFIFPDLSVRHEGMYLLSFNLYEETKDPEDRDADAQDAKAKGPAAADSSFDWRLEIKSDKFTVYSAKKFPGLAESTSISRTVAEQGCRVRIRRDVRMRRREGKGSGDLEAQEEEYARASRPAEQDFERTRSRSNSGSPDGRGPYQDGYRPVSNSPIAPAMPAPPGGALGFLDHNRNEGHFAAPQANFAPPPAPQHQYPPPQSTYQQPAPAPYERYASQPQPAHPGYGRQYPASAVDPPREQMYEQPQYRRASEAAHQAHYAHPSGQYPSVDASHRPPPYQGYAAPPSPAILPPLRLGEKRESFHSSRETLSSLSHFAPPLHSPSYDRSHERQGSYSQYGSTPLAPAPVPTGVPTESPRVGAKRAYDSVFSSAATTRPLHNGMRPGSLQGENSAFDDGADDDDEELGINQMQYKRADGTDFSRTLPCLQ